MKSAWSRLLDRSFLLHGIFSVLFIMLLPVGEAYFFLRLRDEYDIFLMLGIAAATGLIGSVVFIFIVLRLQRRVKETIAAGELPLGEFRQLVGAVAGTILILLPGFASDAVAVLLMLPVFQRLAGRILFRNAEERLKDLYTWAKLY